MNSIESTNLDLVKLWNYPKQHHYFGKPNQQLQPLKQSSLETTVSLLSTLIFFTVIKSLKNNKTPGLGNVPNFALKHLSESYTRSPRLVNPKLTLVINRNNRVATRIAEQLQPMLQTRINFGNEKCLADNGDIWLLMLQKLCYSRSIQILDGS